MRMERILLLLPESIQVEVVKNKGEETMNKVLFTLLITMMKMILAITIDDDAFGSSCARKEANVHIIGAFYRAFHDGPYNRKIYFLITCT